MNTLNFNSENKAIILVPELTQSNNEGNENFYSEGEEKRNKGQVELAFVDNDNRYTTNPTINQKNALDYIINNQQELVKAFYKYTKEILYPTHIKFIGFDEINFPEINSYKDLRKTLGISEIYIWTEYKIDISYVAFRFDFSGDFEHGVILITHKNIILEWEEDLVKDKILVDLNQNN